MPNQGQKIIRLTTPQLFQLATWLNAYRDELAKGVYSYDEVAQLLTPDVAQQLLTICTGLGIVPDPILQEVIDSRN